MVRIVYAELHWYEATALAQESTRSENSENPMKRVEKRFVICVKNKGYTASLELRKLYQVVADGTAVKVGHVRVVDESGEDYLYPEQYFVPVRLPPSAGKAVRRAASSGT